MSQNLHFRIEIDAPADAVWEHMLGDAGYRDWTAAFCEGSYFEGRWESGTDMRFLGPSGEGMRAHIDEARRPEYVSIRHLGELRAGQADGASDWQGVFERYRLQATGGRTLLEVELTGVPDAYVEMMDTAWPLALARLQARCTGR